MRRLDAEDEKGKHIGGFQNRLDYIPGCHCYDPGGITIVKRKIHLLEIWTFKHLGEGLKCVLIFIGRVSGER